jgi:hypothetical protein
MNQEQTQNVFIGLLAAGLILLGGGMYLISQQVKSVATSVKGIQRGSVQQQPAPQPSQPAADSGTSRTTNPLLSPDSEQLLAYRKVGVADAGELQTDTVTHIFELRTADGRMIRELFNVVEQVTKDQDGSGTNEWTPLGWNAQGDKVYVAVTPIPGGLGGNYPEADRGAKMLIEVDVETGQRKTILDLGRLWNVQNGIYLVQATQPRKDILIYSELEWATTVSIETLYVSGFDLQQRQTVMTFKSDGAVGTNSGVAHVEMDSTNQIMLITTFEVNPDDSYTYKNWEYNIATKNLRPIAR